jgi:chromosome segregation ATPase
VQQPGISLPDGTYKTREADKHKQDRGTQTFQVDSGSAFTSHPRPYDQVAELNSLKAAHASLEEAYNDVKNSRDDLRRNIKTLEIQESKARKLGSQVVHIRSNEAKLIRDVESLEAKFSESQQQLSTLENSIDSGKSTNAFQEQELSKKKQEIERYKKEFNDFKSEISRQNQEIQRLNKTTDQHRVLTASRNRQEIEQYKRELNDLKSAISRQNQEISRLQTAGQHRTLTVSGETQELSQNNEEIERYRKELDDLKSEKDRQTQEISRLDQTVQQYRDFSTALGSQIQKTSNDTVGTSDARHGQTINNLQTKIS